MEFAVVLALSVLFFFWLMSCDSRQEPRTTPPVTRPMPEETFFLRISDPHASQALYGYAFSAEQWGDRALADEMYEMAERWNHGSVGEVAK